jgi:eukaryotic-like serine/threonine-protein kinase
MPNDPRREGFDRLLETLGGTKTLESLPPSAAVKPAPASDPDAARTLPLLPCLAPPGGDPSDLEPLKLLGEGGMGRVELARQRSLQREVALKRLRPGQETPFAAQRLLREALIAGALEHPNIVPVHSLWRDDADRPLLVMKRIEGVPLGELIRAPERPAWAGLGGDRLARYLEILMQAANALHFAHSRGVIHRDLKPDNIMVGDFGEVYVLDWGLALRLEERAKPAARGLVGTPAYIAPEMLAGGARVSPATDVYLLGATLHEILTGRPRHQGENLEAVLFSAFESRPYDYGDEVPRELADICNKAMAPEPEARYASALELRRALSDFLTHRGALALSAAAEERLAELEGVLQRGPGGDARPRLRKLLAECRFGFQQALREWSGDARAEAGLARCLTRMAEYELSQKNAEAAEALLQELDQPPEALLAALAALREERRRAEEERARLLALERQLDLGLFARQRAAGLVGLGLLIAAAPLAVFVFRIEVTHAVGLAFVGGFFLVALLWLALGRRILLSNAANRRLAACLVLGFVASGINRLFGMLLQIPVPRVIVSDCLLLGAFYAALGVFLGRRFFMGSGLFLAAALLAAAAPGYAVAGLTLSFLAAVVLVFLPLARMQRPTGEAPRGDTGRGPTPAP